MKGSIDKGIVGLVNSLNKEGFTTGFSCSGHGYQGYVSFKRAINISKADAISAIFLKHGIKRFKLLDLQSRAFIVRPNRGLIRYAMFLLPGARKTTFYDKNPQRRDSKIMYMFKSKDNYESDLKDKRLKFI